MIAGNPDRISQFEANNISFKDDPQNYNQPADVTYSLGTGDCEDFAQFACTLLYSGGWSYATFDDVDTNAAAGLDVQWGTALPDGRFPYGHAVCLYRKAGGPFRYLDNRGELKGPFQTVDQAVQNVLREAGIPQAGRYTFFDASFTLTLEVRY